MKKTKSKDSKDIKFKLKLEPNSFPIKLLSHYLSWYGVYNLLFAIILTSFIGNLYLLIFVAFEVFEFILWKRNVYKFRKQNQAFLDMVCSYRSVCFLGAVRSGKSSLAWHLLNKFCIDKDLLYISTENEGYKKFTKKHLRGDVALEEGFCALVDEAGGIYDSFKYDHQYDEERSDIMNFNKYIGQNYGNDSYLFYVDQSSANMNTILKRAIVYYVLNLSITRAAAPMIPFLIYQIINSIFHLTDYNLFNLISYNYKDFVKLDDFAEHYEVNYDALVDKNYIVPAVKVFSNNDTRVFKKYNRAKVEAPEYWGDNKSKDIDTMVDNYGLVREREKINIKVDIDTTEKLNETLVLEKKISKR